MTKLPEAPSADVAADLAALRQDVARLADSMTALMQGQAQGAAQRVSDIVDDAKAKVTSTAADVKSRVNAAGGEIEASIERNPLTAMLISFGVGMALGMMSRSRH
ncbi:DUF883 family protein [Roseomonas sp. PWR1]|uniref:DUF883 family protein n=1 Tax=Roseomonas nitratireducens TaxID=2820810 RepID=A0ABS4AS61_9PROT|nr:DUF883 family protein [Neoroseomonas nitratireducens]MBP0464190.1 DUF883 family protein [Neoroseomonas nitratireducens]